MQVKLDFGPTALIVSADLRSSLSKIRLECRGTFFDLDQGMRAAGVSHGAEGNRLTIPTGARIAVRWLWLTIIVLFSAVILLFIVQNRDVVSLSYLHFNTRAPFALLVGIAYVVGALTGGSMLALLRRSYEGSKRSAVTSN